MQSKDWHNKHYIDMSNLLDNARMMQKTEFSPCNPPWGQPQSCPPVFLHFCPSTFKLVTRFPASEPTRLCALHPLPLSSYISTPNSCGSRSIIMLERFRYRQQSSYHVLLPVQLGRYSKRPFSIRRTPCVELVKTKEKVGGNKLFRQNVCIYPF